MNISDKNIVLGVYIYFVLQSIVLCALLCAGGSLFYGILCLIIALLGIPYVFFKKKGAKMLFFFSQMGFALLSFIWPLLIVIGIRGDPFCVELFLHLIPFANIILMILMFTKSGDYEI